MSEPLFHPTTVQIITQFKKNLPQSLLVSGPPGIGLTTAARWLTDDTIIDYIAPRDAKGNITISGTIGVEAIRLLYEQTRSRTTNRQIILISNAERMSSAASGAFLKLLEEPNAYVYFILTSHQPHQLLPTIRSRVQQIELQPITKEQTATFIASHTTDPTKKLQLEFLASGLPAEITRLVEDDAYFSEQAKIISDARDFLKGDRYKKLLVIQSYRQDRNRTLQLCDTVLALLRRTLLSQPQPAVIVQIERLLEARERIAANGNAMLQLTQFVI